MAVSYSDIQAVADTKKRLIAQAQKELHGLLRGADATQMYDAVMGVMDKYGLASAELGAQWYETSAQKAGETVESAVVNEIDLDKYSVQIEDILADWELGDISDEELWEMFDEVVSEGLINISRGTVFDNMRRDQALDWRINRNDMRVRYARVPVGETCAFCLMLASLGPWYLSEESAGAYDPDHFHSHCDCEVVAYTDMEDIDGYQDTLDTYRDMYYDSRSLIEDEKLSPELQERIAKAKEQHDKDYEEGRTREKWSITNEILIVMRDLYGVD